MRRELHPILTISFLIAGCGASPPPAPADPAEPLGAGRPVETAAPEVSPAEAAVEMRPSCSEGTLERCDAVDQNCDGHIDEGCGYESGALQVTLAWNSDADVDLVVTDPSDAVLSPAHTEVASGGTLDRQASGACGQASRDRIENARWADSPPSGEYRVALRYASECEREVGATTATVAISAAGRVLGVYNVTLEPEAEAPVATVRIP